MENVAKQPFDPGNLTHQVHYGGLQIGIGPDAAAYLRRCLAKIAQAVNGENTHDVIGITGTNLVSGASVRFELLIGPGIPIVIEGPR
jgi:hypothetical protein